MSEYIYLESKLAETLGLSQATMRKGRKLFLEEGADFGRIKHESRNRIAYTHEAAERIIEGMAESPEFGSRATGHLEVSDIALVLSSSIVREAEDSAHEKKSTDERRAKETSTAPGKLLAAPWQVPDAVLVVVRRTKNSGIIEATLHPAWVNKHGFEYYNRILQPVLRPEEAANPDLFKTKLFRVKVKNSRNFIKGMELQARWIQQDLWECAQRMPRYKGRW